MLVVQVEAEPAARAFYEEAAAAAAALGVCIDLYAASEEGMGLAFLEPLGSITGGATYLYPALDEATLPQARNSIVHLADCSCQVSINAVSNVRSDMSCGGI